jgi:hypothetical protein
MEALPKQDRQVLEKISNFNIFESLQIYGTATQSYYLPAEVARYAGDPDLVRRLVPLLLPDSECVYVNKECYLTKHGVYRMILSAGNSPQAIVFREFIYRAIDALYEHGVAYRDQIIDSMKQDFAKELDDYYTEMYKIRYEAADKTAQITDLVTDLHSAMQHARALQDELDASQSPEPISAMNPYKLIAYMRKLYQKPYYYRYVPDDAAWVGSLRASTAANVEQHVIYADPRDIHIFEETYATSNAKNQKMYDFNELDAEQRMREIECARIENDERELQDIFLH